MRSLLPRTALWLALLGLAACQSPKPMITHTVAFRLKHAPGSAEEISFLDAARQLQEIETVENFSVLQQVGKKTDYTYGLSMDFADQQAFDFYNNHPDHVAFVQTRWIPEVEKFVELDYVPATAK